MIEVSRASRGMEALTRSNKDASGNRGIQTDFGDGPEGQHRTTVLPQNEAVLRVIARTPRTTSTRPVFRRVAVEMIARRKLLAHQEVTATPTHTIPTRAAVPEIS